MINVLSISLDASLAKPGLGRVEDACTRHLEYARNLGKLSIITRTPSLADITERIQLDDNLFVYPASSSNRYAFLRDTYQIGCRIISAEVVDVLTAQDAFATGMVGFLLKKKYNIPLNIQLHSSDFSDNRYWLAEKFEHRLFLAVGAWLLRRADTIRVVASDSKSALISKLNISPDRIFVLPVRVDLEAFEQAQADSGLKDRYLSQGFKIVLAVGALIYQKDFDTLIRAVPHILSRHPKTIFIIVGQGPQDIHLGSLAEKLGVTQSVILAGSIPHEKIPGFFAACNVFVLSSVYEGLARVRLEAAAASKPVVTTDVDGSRDVVIEGETGFVVPKKDHRAISDRVIQLLDDPAMAAEMGRQGQAHVRQGFDKEKNVQELVNIWLKTAQYHA